MGCAERIYQTRHAAAGVLHGVIRDYVDDFLRAAADRPDGTGLLEFIAREFRKFLTRGVLAHGFARVRCAPPQPQTSALPLRAAELENSRPQRRGPGLTCPTRSGRIGARSEETFMRTVPRLALGLGQP